MQCFIHQITIKRCQTFTTFLFIISIIFNYNEGNFRFLYTFALMREQPWGKKNQIPISAKYEVFFKLFLKSFKQ